MNRRIILTILFLTLVISASSVTPARAIPNSTMYVAPGAVSSLPMGSLFNVTVKITTLNSPDNFNTWDIELVTSSTLSPITPIKIFATNVCPSSTEVCLNPTNSNVYNNATGPTIVEPTNCVNGSGSGCDATLDGPGIAHSVVGSSIPSAGPGRLFVVEYQVTAATGSSPININPSNDFLINGATGGLVAHTDLNSFYGTPPHDTSTGVSCVSPVVVGQASACTATVTDTAASPTTPTGTVGFTSTGSGSLGASSCSLVAGAVGTASCSVNFNPTATGSATVTGTYNGDPTHNTSTSSPASITIGLRQTSTTVGCPASATPGVAVTCSADVTDTSPGTATTPTGTITWTHNNTGTFSPGICTLSVVGSCSTQYTPGATGTHHITGDYSGDSIHGTSSASANIAIRPDFTIEANVTSVIVPRGTSHGYNVTVTSINGFTGKLTLTELITPTPTSPPGISLTNSTFTGSTVTVTLTANGNANVTVLVTSTSTTSTGTYTLTVSATNGTLIRSVPVQVNIPDFAVTVSPNTVAIPRGSSNIHTVTLEPLYGFQGSVTLTATVSNSTVTSQPTAGMNSTITGTPSNPITVTVTSASNVPVTLNITTALATPIGNYNVTITADSQFLTHKSTVIFTVADFRIVATPASLPIPPGGSATTFVVLAALFNFDGKVNVTATTTEPGITLSPAVTVPPLTLTSLGNNYHLTVLVASTVPSGVYTVTLNATSGKISEQPTIPLTVTVLASANLAVVSVRAYPTTVTIGNSLTVIAVVNNTGSVDENFTVKVLWEPSAVPFTVAQQDETLAAGKVGNYTITWNTKGYDPGNGTLVVVASFVPNESNLADNIHRDGAIILAAPPGPLLTSTQVVYLGIGIAAGAAALASLLLRRRRKADVLPDNRPRDTPK